jgi:hypothetical protein
MRALWKLARRQLGLITTAQAMQLVTRHQFETIAERYLRPVRRGVWAVAGAPETYEQTVLAAVLAAGDFAWTAERTAAKLRGLKVPPPDEIDVLTLPNRRLHMSGVRQHRNASISADDIGRVGVIPATTAAKTLVDCLPWLPGPMFQIAVDDARRRGLVTYEEVVAAHGFIDRGRRTGRHLVVPARPVLADRHNPGGSDRELDVLGILRRAGLPLPVQQHPIYVARRWRSLDYAYPEPKIYLEWDGFNEHGLIRSTFDDDRERDAELALLGWLGLHFTSNTQERDLANRVERALLSRVS